MLCEAVRITELRMLCSVAHATCNNKDSVKSRCASLVFDKDRYGEKVPCAPASDCRHRLANHPKLHRCRRRRLPNLAATSHRQVKPIDRAN